MNNAHMSPRSYNAQFESPEALHRSSVEVHSFWTKAKGLATQMKSKVKALFAHDKVEESNEAMQTIPEENTVIQRESEQLSTGTNSTKLEENVKVPDTLPISVQIDRIRNWAREDFQLTEGVTYAKEAKIIGLLHRANKQIKQEGVTDILEKEAIFLDLCARAFMHPNELSYTVDQFYDGIKGEGQEHLLYQQLSDEISHRWAFRNKSGEVIPTLDATETIVKGFGAKLREEYKENPKPIDDMIAYGQSILDVAHVYEREDEYCQGGVTLNDYLFALVLAQRHQSPQELPEGTKLRFYDKTLWNKVPLIMGVPEFNAVFKKNVSVAKAIQKSISEHMLPGTKHSEDKVKMYAFSRKK